MVKNLLLTFAVFCLSAGMVSAQYCGTDELNRLQRIQYPEIAQFQTDLDSFVKNYVAMQNSNMFKQSNPDDLNDTMFIPVVVHVIHDYGNENVSDTRIYDMLEEMNQVFQKRNADLVTVIPPFVPYIGNPLFQFKLATKDPYGNPTKGITRTVSYLTHGGNNQAKLNQWAPNRYLNIWLTRVIGSSSNGGTTLAYATPPASAAANPYGDGILAASQYITGGNHTVAHEAGHIFNLPHTWGNGEVDEACGDDGIDDTPPTKGHFSTCPLYDTNCINKSASVGKFLLDTNNFKTSTSTTDGISFTTRSAIIIQNVTVYPSGPVGDTFTIVLKKGSSVVDSFTDVIVRNDTLQQVGVNFIISNWDTLTGFSMEFSRNPGMKLDTNVVAFAKDIFGAITLTNENDANYNFFYRWQVRYGYFKPHPTVPLQIADYPDTTNTQNIMDYSNCTNMFTKGQVAHMRAVFKSTVGNRNVLIDSANLAFTGFFDPRPDLPPVADYSTNLPFRVADGLATVTLTNQSWNDTVSSVNWTFGSGVSPSTSNSTGNVILTSNTPGWMDVTMDVTGNGASGTGNLQNNTKVYWADPNGKNPHGLIQEFDGSSVSEWPIFNYYENDWKWSLNSQTGTYDKSSIMFNGFDNRTFPTILLNMPNGDYDDFYTPAFDIKNNMPTEAYLTFYYAGAYRTNIPANMKDKLEISYSTNGGQIWFILDSLSGPQVASDGTHTEEFIPTVVSHWKQKSVKLPVAALNSERVYFRFRYRANAVSADSYNSFALPVSNNFYMDRIQVSPFSLDVADAMLLNKNIAVAPNPTSGSATVYVAIGNQAQDVTLNVMDITGKLIYSAKSNVSGNAKLEVPASALKSQGVYLIQVESAAGRFNTKLVVN